MLSGDFQLKLRKCSSKLRIYCGNDETKPAGIYHVSDPESPICGIDKNFVPEWSKFDDLSGRILKGGWKRALRILIERGYVERSKAERVFGSQIIGTRRPEYSGPAGDKIQAELRAAKLRGLEKFGTESLTKSELMDIASEINHASK